tara:strand:- start:802 stop:1032 length:231 start_codon:yes stop_codon:yes gene_type:complete
MIENLISMNGYGLYVWSSFGVITFSCWFLYYKTLKKLRKYEKDLAVIIEKLPIKERQRIAKSSKIANEILTTYKII